MPGMGVRSFKSGARERLSRWSGLHQVVPGVSQREAQAGLIAARRWLTRGPEMDWAGARERRCRGPGWPGLGSGSRLFKT